MKEENIKIKEEAIIIINKMLDEQDWTPEIMEYKIRIQSMYEKEIIHIIEMNEKVQTMLPFKRVFLGRTVSNTDFEYQSVEELVQMSIKNIQDSFKKIMI